eukprot:TRINITY_DN5626_c0_g1_i3.p1 TRINITY_DN5626_c0_g1~~TRINITY_DN5626_c0_g1_i3.p1  ORF type:complete len:237 (-),score=51.23 TRINITY_DN5626_c0_g1_i3:42-752(-)
MSLLEGERIEIGPPTKGSSISFSTLYLGLHQALSMMMNMNGVEEGNSGMELFARIASLENELDIQKKESDSLKTSLKQMIAFYKMHCPDLPPPEYIDLSSVGGGWNAQPAQNVNRSEILGSKRARQTDRDGEMMMCDGPERPIDIDINRSIDSPLALSPRSNAILEDNEYQPPHLPALPPPENQMVVVDVTADEEPADIEEKLSMLLDFFPHISKAELKVALKKENYNVELAANHL